MRRPTLADGVSPWLQEILLTAPIRRFDNLVQTCGIAVRTERVLLGIMAITVLVVVVSNSMFESPTISFAAGFGFGIALPLFVQVADPCQ